LQLTGPAARILGLYSHDSTWRDVLHCKFCNAFTSRFIARRISPDLAQYPWLWYERPPHVSRVLHKPYLE